MNPLRVQINPEDIIFQENGPFPKNLEGAIYFYNLVETFFIKINCFNKLCGSEEERGSVMYRQVYKSSRSDKFRNAKELESPIQGEIPCCKKGLGSPGGQQVEHEPTVYPCSKGGQQHPELY